MFGIASISLLLLVLCVQTWRRPAVGFAGVLCLYGLKQWGQNSSLFFAQNRTAINYAVAVLVLLGLFRYRRKLFTVGTLSKEWCSGVLLYFYAFVTLLWSPDIAAALEQWSLQIPYVLMIAVAAPLLVTEMQDVKVAFNWTILIGGAICCLALLFGAWGPRGLLVNGDFLRNQTNPLAIASLGGTLCVISMISVMGPVSWVGRAVRIVIALIGVGVILRSGSRGQLVAAMLAIVVGMPMAAKKRNIGAWLVMIVVVAVVVQGGLWMWDELGVDSARWSGKRSGEDAEGRLMMAETLLTAAMKNPFTLLFGLGNSSAFHYVGFYPHIAMLEVLAEEGVLGFLLYCAIIVLSVRNLVALDSNVRRQQDHVGNQVVATLAALFVFEWVLTFKQGTLLSSVYVIAYAAIAGALYNQLKRLPPVKNDESVEIPSTGHILNLMR